MSKYQFYLNTCDIMDTRSVHQDTIVAGLGVIVNGVVPQPPQVAQVGNHNNGQFSFWQHGLGSIDQVTIGPNDFFAFAFEIFNNGHSGHPSVAELGAFIDRDLINANAYYGAKPAQGQDIQLSVWCPGSNWQSAPQGPARWVTAEGNLWSGGVFSAIAEAVSGADGPLAFGLIFGLGSALDLRIPAVGPLLLSTEYRAKDLSLGEPGNPAGSNYVINIIVQRR